MVVLIVRRYSSQWIFRTKLHLIIVAKVHSRDQTMNDLRMCLIERDLDVNFLKDRMEENFKKLVD